MDPSVAEAMRRASLAIESARLAKEQRNLKARNRRAYFKEPKNGDLKCPDHEEDPASTQIS